MVAYYLVIRVGFREKSYGIPLVAILLNLSWELIYTFIFPPEMLIKRVLFGAWFGIDMLVFYQLLRYGKRVQVIPDIQRHFYAIVFLTFLWTFVGHLTFRVTFSDLGGVRVAFMQNMVMSVLFVFMLFSRRDLRGLSYGAAWFKMIGTLIISVSDFLMVRGSQAEYGFMTFLYVSIVIFDAFYLGLFTRERARLKAGEPDRIHPAPA